MSAIRLRSAGNTVAARNVASSIDRSDGAESGNRTSGADPFAARWYPHSPKLGTEVWYGVVFNPAARRDASIDQYDFGAKYGDPDWTTMRPSSARACIASAY